jgi:uncharacterized protein (TIGR03000 family)
MRPILQAILLVTVLALASVEVASAQQVIVGVRTGGVGVYYGPAYRRYWWEYSTYPYGYVPYRVGVYVGPRYDPYWGEPYYGYYPYVYPRYVYPVVPIAPPSTAEYHVVPRAYPSASPNGELTAPRIATSRNTAEITIILPVADAEVTVEDYPVRTGGPRRVLESPELQPGKLYTYTITATWKQGEETVRKKKQVTVQAGSRVVVDFTQPEPDRN